MMYFIPAETPSSKLARNRDRAAATPPIPPPITATEIWWRDMLSLYSYEITKCSISCASRTVDAIEAHQGDHLILTDLGETALT
jgi:hypothetical protein